MSVLKHVRERVLKKLYIQIYERFTMLRFVARFGAYDLVICSDAAVCRLRQSVHNESSPANCNTPAFYACEYIVKEKDIV